MSNFFKAGSGRHSDSKHRSTTSGTNPALEVPDYGYSAWATPAAEADVVAAPAISLYGSPQTPVPAPAPTQPWATAPAQFVPQPPNPFGPADMPTSAPLVAAPIAQAAPALAPVLPRPTELAAPGEALAAPQESDWIGANQEPAPWQPIAASMPTGLAAPVGYVPTAAGTPTSSDYVSTSFRAAPKKTRRGYKIAGVIVLVWMVLISVYWYVHYSSMPSLPHGTGVAAGNPTVPPPGPGQVFTSRAGHFAVLVPSASDMQSTTSSFSGAGVTANYYRSADVPRGYVVMGMDLSADMSPSDAQDFLRGVMSNGDIGPVSGQKAISFQGRPARTGELVINGVPLKMMAFVNGSRRAYVILAPAGTAFDNLESSFVALP